MVICGYNDKKGEFYVSDTLHPETLAVAISDMERARSAAFPPYVLKNKSFIVEDLSGFRIDEAVVQGTIRLWAEENLNGDLSPEHVPHLELDFCHFIFPNSGMTLAWEDCNSKICVASLFIYRRELCLLRIEVYCFRQG